MREFFLSCTPPPPARPLPRTTQHNTTQPCNTKTETAQYNTTHETKAFAPLMGNSGWAASSSPHPALRSLCFALRMSQLVLRALSAVPVPRADHSAYRQLFHMSLVVRMWGEALSVILGCVLPHVAAVHQLLLRRLFSSNTSILRSKFFCRRNAPDDRENQR